MLQRSIKKMSTKKKKIWIFQALAFTVKSQVNIFQLEWKCGSYVFKHSPLGFISSLTWCCVPGLKGLTGNLLLHRWLCRMAAQCATKGKHWICQIAAFRRTSVFSILDLHSLVSAPSIYYRYYRDESNGIIKIFKNSPDCHACLFLGWTFVRRWMIYVTWVNTHGVYCLYLPASNLFHSTRTPG